jgi:hypothetical protein
MAWQIQVSSATGLQAVLVCPLLNSIQRFQDLRLHSDAPEGSSNRNSIAVICIRLKNVAAGRTRHISFCIHIQ